MKIILNFSECIISFFSLCLLCVVFSCDEMDIDQGPPTSVTRNLMTSDGPGLRSIQLRTIKFRLNMPGKYCLLKNLLQL